MIRIDAQQIHSTQSTSHITKTQGNATSRTFADVLANELNSLAKDVSARTILGASNQTSSGSTGGSTGLSSLGKSVAAEEGNLMRQITHKD